MVKPKSPRLAVRALILDGQGRLLLVNAYPGGQSDLWCAPGGGMEAGASMPENLAREVHEETGLTVDVGMPVLINEFHDPATGFHQVEVFFRCMVTAGKIDAGWQDPEQIVTERRFFSQAEMDTIRFKPDSLRKAAWSKGQAEYDPLETILN